MHHHPVAAARADRGNDPNDKASEQGERQEEEPCGLDDAVFADGDGIGLVDGTEHGYHIAADGNILAEADAAEHADQVVSDGSVVIGLDVAKEVDHIVLGDAGDVDVAEEDDDVAGDTGVGIDLDAAEEADGVVDRVAGGGMNLFAKVGIVLQVLGLTYEQRRPQLVEKLGEPAVEFFETTATVLDRVRKEGF